ncbi:MAG: hypothetical protein ACOX1F_02540 [Erysipelotrichaceae bacterium]
MKLIIKFFFDAIKESPKFYLLSFLWSIINALLTAIVPWILDFIFKLVKSSNNFIYFYVVLLFLFLFLLLIFIEIKWYISLDKFGGSYISKLSIRCQETVLDSNTFNIKYNELKHILSSNILDIFRTIGHHFPKITSSIAIVAFSLFFSFLLDKKISFFIIISFFIGIVITFYSKKISRTLRLIRIIILKVFIVILMISLNQ